MPLFPYPELPTTDGLRLLTLEPANKFFDDLEGTLESISFSSKPRYIALSYTWDDPYTSDTEDRIPNWREHSVIRLNGHGLQIGLNAAKALRFLRSTKAPVPLWIDAICIDQNSITERNQQVALMAFIYSRAAAVISWLGMPSIDPNKTLPDIDIDIMHEWKSGNAQNIGPEFARAVTNPPKRGGPAKPFSWEWINQRSIKSRHHRRLISTNSYWNRLWIVQEVCLPRHLAFMCGGAIWTESVIWEAAKEMESLSPDVVAESSLPEIRRLRFAREGKFGDRMRLEALVEQFADCGCQEIRDRVFGLVGLANNVNVFARAAESAEPPRLDDSSMSQQHSHFQLGFIEIDYERSFYDIWHDLVRFMSTSSTTPLGTEAAQEEQENERCQRVVRYSGVVQRALEGNVEHELKFARPFPGLSDTPFIMAMGYVAGAILAFGPHYSQYVGSYQAQREWAHSLRQHYSSSRDLETLRRMQDSYEVDILYYSAEDLDRISALNSSKSSVWSILEGPEPVSLGDEPQDPDPGELQRPPAAADPILFLGTDQCMGLAPSIAKLGDLVVRFYNCNAAILIRPTPTAKKPANERWEFSKRHAIPPGPEFLSFQSGYYRIAGRVDVAEPYNREEDRGDRRAMSLMRNVERSLPSFPEEDPAALWEWSRGVYVRLDFQTLQQISAGIEIYGGVAEV